MLKGSLPLLTHIWLPHHSTHIGKTRNSTDNIGCPSVVIGAIAASVFFGFFRLEELLLESPSAFHPAKSPDVMVDNHSSPAMIQFHLKTSKCHQF